MALFNFRCNDCKKTISLFHRNKSKTAVCKCGSKELIREATGASSQVLETIDNGLMARKIERAPDIEETMKKRTQEDLKRKFEL
jgi:DNA-directed RNA polymerase subunit RPC12/RpoP